MAVILCALLAGFAVCLAVQYAESGAALHVFKKTVRRPEPGRPVLFELLPSAWFIKKASGFNGMLPFGKYRAELAEKLALSGAAENCAADEFIARKELLLLIPLVPCLAAGVPFSAILLFSVILFFMPDMELAVSRKKYEKEILRELPAALDILAACVEAGLTFDAAVSKYIEKSGDNRLSAEFRVYIQEVKLGKSRQQALLSVAAKSGLEELNSFSASVSRSLQFGTGMAASLRAQCSAVRSAAARRAEKLAAEAPVKLLFPLVFFIFPVVFIIIFGPLFLRLLSGN